MFPFGKKECESHDNMTGNIICALERIPCEGEGHTSFDLFQCKRCKKAVPFPEDNFKLITQKAKDQIVSELKEKGLELAPEF